MEKKIATKIPLVKLLIAINAMIEEGYTLTNIIIEDEETISLQGIKEEKGLPNINQLEL